MKGKKKKNGEKSESLDVKKKMVERRKNTKQKAL